MENLAQALAEADDDFIFNSEKNRQHADSEDQNGDQLQNSNTVIICLPVQVPGVCVSAATHISSSANSHKPPATWRGLRWRWRWGSDPSTPERWGRRASASFRCQETPQVSISSLITIAQWCSDDSGYDSECNRICLKRGKITFSFVLNLSQWCKWKVWQLKALNQH